MSFFLFVIQFFRILVCYQEQYIFDNVLGQLNRFEVCSQVKDSLLLNNLRLL